MTVRSTTTHATYQLVECADETTRETLSPLSPGESVQLRLTRVGQRGNVWCAEQQASRGAAPRRTRSRVEG
ncbi:hypothetical protein DVK02_04755 [Halobellus sp. Atlit-31R]|nr:hypothetical protein DVK02_04755 [Halobellus sp. Atlit-31R]